MKPYVIKYCCLKCENEFKDIHYTKEDYFEALPCTKCEGLAVDSWKWNKYKSKLQPKKVLTNLKVNIRFDIKDEDIEKIKSAFKDAILNSIQVTTNAHDDDDLPTRLEGSD